MSEPPRPATLRAVVIALAAAGALAWLTPVNDYELQNTYIAGNLFPIGAMAVLLALALVVNPLLRRLAPRHEFRPPEMGLIWGVIAIASGIPAAGFLRYLLPVQCALINYATPENRWAELILPQVKPWLLPRGETAALAFYSGAASGTIPWDAWWITLLMWSTAAAQVFLAVACLTVLLRRQWAERERFSFPLVQLPLAVAASPEPGRSVNAFFRCRLVWLGVAVPALLHGVNGLHLYYPGVPQIDLHYDIAQHIPEIRPWNVAKWGLRLHIWPATIGFAYLLAQEIAFSMWFFRAFEILQRVFMFGTNLATSGNDLQSFAAHEGYGAVIALAIMVALLARPHLREVWRRVVGRPGGASDEREAMSYRLATVGLAVSCLGLCATFVQFGVAPLMTAVIIVIGLAKYTACAWGASNAGLIMVQQAFRPSDLLVSALGSRHFTPATLANTALVENVFLYDLRETLMPSLLNAAQLADETGLRQRSAFRVGAVAIALATVLAAWAWLRLGYDKGGTQLAPGTFVWHAGRVWREVAARLDPGEPVRLINLLGTAIGAGLFFGLMALRLRFVGWPLHPIGLVTIYSWTSNQFGFSFLLGWAIKGVIVRAGGLRLYRQLRPFFLGLILGDVLAAVVLTIVGFFCGQGYFVTPS